jgi:hypothetical protein
MKFKLWFGLCFLFLLVPFSSAAIEVYEGDLVKLNVSVEDPDGDSLNIRFSFPLDANGTWQTSLGDAGEYYTLVNVSDEGEIVSEKVKIIVNKLNIPKFEAEYLIEEGKILRIDFPESAEYDFELPEGFKFSKNKLRFSPGYDFIKPEKDYISRKLFQFKLLPSLNLDLVKVVRIPVSIKVRNVVVDTEILVKVKNVNRAPSFDSVVSEIKVKEGERLNLSYESSDEDNDKLYIFVSGLVNKNNGKIKYNKQGERVVKLRLSDGQEFVEKEIKVHVEDVNRPPKYVGKSVAFVKEGKNVSVKLIGYDPDGDNVTFILKEGFGISKIVGDELIISPSFNLIKDKYKEDKIALELSDGKESVFANISLRVEDAPRDINISSVSPVGPFIMKRGQVIEFEIDVDNPDGRELKYYWDGVESNLSIHKRKMLRPGVRTFAVKVTDGKSKDKFEWKFLVK